LTLVEGGEQGLYVHWHCLRSVLHEEVPLLDAGDYQGGPS
jgi:hypothetical protein